MAKFSGVIGFEEPRETMPGVFEPEVTERAYRGDILRSSRRIESNEQINDNINISNQFSIIADQYAYNHVYCMKYLVYGGTKWRITDVEIQYPRLTLSVGGLYNGNQNTTT